MASPSLDAVIHSWTNMDGITTLYLVDSHVPISFELLFADIHVTILHLIVIAIACHLHLCWSSSLMPLFDAYSLVLEYWLHLMLSPLASCLPLASCHHHSSVHQLHLALASIIIALSWWHCVTLYVHDILLRAGLISAIDLKPSGSVSHLLVVLTLTFFFS